MASSTLLPDPSADLHWSEWSQGNCIHDVFASNAQRHPDRPFVVETASKTSPQRNFTYRQINEASNVLAHHFLQNGISIGDVVMIYAYRGVDLVVSILGTLKAGATFSVVDPAYPSDRQCIYLDVARPRGLVVIQKASKEDGELSSQVRDWIHSHLDLKVEVPALELSDDGILNGGSVEAGRDVLSDQQRLGAQRPDVLLGPDSTPTLSFTSGSEGRPKGVRGRHFSLTHYQPFMRERYNLSEKDRFTMLSGIAHDPIQRDIFTPAFLGATLVVPAKEDIQHERLAEWMRTYQTTVTHLTPAMGQILVGGASAEFPSLHHAFFVGDVLTKRDCRLLQSLARNCRIVNMFGTTETQRAVSYYELPSKHEDPNFLEKMPDVIPAGRGMQNVQLLVVDRASLENKKPELCSVGGVGEIFVRAGGLAEGYLGSDELNKEKFVNNFFLSKPNVWMEREREDLDRSGHKEPWREFWRGPRDRLYRSGDLGRYLESGDVECTGRADNQIKIRGFRIELGEIDSHLSKHPLIRENVTLVRRDKDEEPNLVSYVVVDQTKWPQWLEEKGLPDDVEDDTMRGMLHRFRALRDDARLWLKKKLPAYAVPNVYIPLKAMPVTPNYKIDRRALPYPDAADLTAAATAGKQARQTFSETQKTVGAIWSSRLGIPADVIDLDDCFYDLGGHSLKAQEVLFDLKRRTGLKISMNTISQNASLRDFAAVIDAAQEAQQHHEGKTDSTPPEMDYALDSEVLKTKMSHMTFPPGPIQGQTILVTGTTGFLGVAILMNLLNRSQDIRVIAIVRAKSSSEALHRVKTTCTAYDTWSDDWEGRLKCIPGDLAKEQLGLSPDVFYMLETTVDVVIHNGAVVHWIRTYSSMKATNVLSTLSLVQLCSTGKPKRLIFVSSTAVLDSGAYVLDSSILEFDDLCRSKMGLTTGYAQTKWVSEDLVRFAGGRGLNGTIVRPGYITGNADKGIGPTDDFLLRMLKGSIQLGCRPDLGNNTINLVPVSYCAQVVVSASLCNSTLPGKEGGVSVAHVTPHPQLEFNEFLATLETYGYNVPLVPYATWREKLEEYVSSESVEKREAHALLPLFDWVTDDLPKETKSKVLDDRNARAVLEADMEEAGQRVEVTQEVVGRYLGFMVAVGFIPAPAGGRQARDLPKVEISDAQREALTKVGRGGGA